MMNQQLKNVLQHFELEPTLISSPPLSHSSKVYILEFSNHSKKVLKIPFNQIKFMRETRALDLLKDAIIVPEIFAALEPGEVSETGALLMSYINGQAGIIENNPELAFSIGEHLAKIHLVQFNQFNDNHLSWVENLRNIFMDWISLIQDYIAPKVVDLSLNFMNSSIENIPFEEQAVLTHFDFQPNNIIINKNKVAGIIDFESSKGGSADMDFTKISWLLWKSFPATKTAFLSGYQQIKPLPNYKITLPFYQFWNAFGGMAWCVKHECIGNDFYYENFSRIKTYLEV